jgi:hypothetical protein
MDNPTPEQDYATFIEWRYELIAEICERLQDEESDDYE